MAGGDGGVAGIAAHGAGGGWLSPPLTLVRPARAHLPSYTAALRRGWSASNINSAAVAAEELAQIGADPDGFLAALSDPAGRGAPITLANGTKVPRLPGFRRWMWDGEVCGSIGFRWQPPGSALPDWVHGHVGYTVVPWKRRQGHATTALALLLDEVRPLGLPHVDLTTDADNLPSQRVITRNGGALVARIRIAGGERESLLWRIAL